jgi:hypothetical protein
VARDLDEALAFLAGTLTAADRVLVTGSCFSVAATLFKLGFTDLEKTRLVRPAPPVLDRILQAKEKESK